jgi:glycosyltransferase involved in cell wall biosynthesis
MFVLPTIRESFGLAALEARCAGVPVVAMRASGVAEHIEHDVNGLLADSDAELAMHVAALLRDPVRRASLAARNRESAPPVAWPLVLERHLALYQQAIDMRRV